MTKLNYKLEGNKSGPTLVFINGLFATKESWENITRNLVKNYQVLTYDTRGQGKLSPALSEFDSFTDLANELNELLNYLNIKEPVNLIGISFGAKIALKFSSIFQSRVNSIFAANTYHEMTPFLKHKINSWRLANLKGGPLHRFEVALPWIWSEKTIESKPELIEFYRKNASVIDKEKANKLLTLVMQETVDLGKIECPVLICAGKEDILTPVSYHYNMAKNIKCAHVVEVDAGHASLIEAPEEVVGYLGAFLNTVNGRENASSKFLNREF